MNTNQYPKRQNRPNRFVSSCAALLACTLALGSVVWLFSDAVGAASVLVQQHAVRHA
jgi:hypothetical protein